MGTAVGLGASVVIGFLASVVSFRGERNLKEGRSFLRGSGFSSGALLGVESGLCYDGVGGLGGFLWNLGLRRESPPRSGRYEGVSVVVRGVAEVPRLLRLPRVPCSPEGVWGAGRIAPPPALVFSSVGVFGASWA